MHYRYFYLRNLAWQTLIDSKCDCLPIDLDKICDFYGYSLLKYSDHSKTVESFQRKTNEFTDAFACRFKSLPTIFFNDKLSPPLFRFKIAHEIGHLVLLHNKVSNIDFEKEAKSFAARILMPIGVLNALNVSAAEEIQQFCNVTIESASFRMERLKQLRIRNVFGTSELERKLLLQFSHFIADNKIN